MEGKELVEGKWDGEKEVIVLIMSVSFELEAESGDHIRHILNLELNVDIFLLINSDFLYVVRTQSCSQIAVMHDR